VLQTIDTAGAFSAQHDHEVVLTRLYLVVVPGDLTARAVRRACLPSGWNAFQIDIVLRRSAGDESQQRNEKGANSMGSVRDQSL